MKKGEISAIDPPDAAGYLWDVYLTISSTRQSGMGANPILLSEIGWYTKLYHFELYPWEVDAILKTDEKAREVFLTKGNKGLSNSRQNSDLLKDTVTSGKAKVIKG